MPPLDATLARPLAALLEKPAALRAAAPNLIQLAEAIQPGAAVVADLRRGQSVLEGVFASDLHTEFVLLGQVVSAAAVSRGGLVVEASRRERARVAAIAAAAKLQTWAVNRLLPVYRMHYKRILESTERILKGHGIRATVRDVIEQEILQTGGKRMGLLDIENDVKESLFRVIDAGREKGLNPRSTAKLIQEYVPQGRYVNAGSSYRSRMIARTEVLHGQRLSSIRIYEGSPVVEKVVAFDGDHDDVCAARSGTVYSFSEAELQMEETHPQCVLAFGPVT